MDIRKVVPAVALAGAFGIPAVASASLIDRGDGLIYDDALDITWLQDASLGGDRSREGAVNWADEFVFRGLDDWRLPSMDVNGDTDVVDCRDVSEVVCRDNELGYMFYHNLDGSFGDDLTGDQGFIEGIQPFHWSSTVFDPDSDIWWGFRFRGGDQGGVLLDSAATWAVRSGDVSPTPVPEPFIGWLLAVGLASLGLVRRCARTGSG